MDMRRLAFWEKASSGSQDNPEGLTALLLFSLSPLPGSYATYGEVFYQNL